ncbi:helix-turn-helix transcriptional regulator [Rhodospirillum sp. A1_3_36]|uniref:helix-turn-helix transcriptional regulator n=1 Tax=Rhodospirillum sp. A1_3_36 TaxID=3391666 RepID=UPI0039A76F16
MRASRLLNILTTLQARGRVTAPELAREMGVTPRTIYRDMDHLSQAGVPVYSDRGPEGGYRLLDGYRVRLNGLSTQEAEALFLTGLPEQAADLGLGSVLASAERKLTVALPEDLRHSAERIRERFHLDTLSWFGEREHPAHLGALADAVWKRKRIEMRYRSWRSEKSVTVDPLGLVLKGGAWYMVARTGDEPRTYRISRVLDLLVTDKPFDPPRDFVLATYWQENTRRLDAEIYPLSVRVRLSERGLELVRHLHAPFAVARMTVSEETDADGWREATLPAAAPKEAVFDFLRLGAEAEVLEPPELRTLLADTAALMAHRHTPC